MYFNSGVVPVQCLSCTSPCATCDFSATSCTSCVATYTYASSSCTCDSLSQLFYSAVALGCVSCVTLISNCVTCNTALTTATCTLCSDPYYVSASNTCVLCDITCTSCTGIGLCTACANNLVVVGGYCVPNTGLDPTLAYDATTNRAVSCLSMLSSCTSCTPSPLACTVCLSGTFLSGGVCTPCSTTCTTCNSLGCITCPSGMALNVSTCVCGSGCT